MNYHSSAFRNNDLYIMLFAGVGLYFFNTYIFPISIQHQFLMGLAFSFISALFMDYFYQSLEWALFFILGLVLVALTPYLLSFLAGNNVTALSLINQVFLTGRYGLFLLSSWIIGIPIGYLLRKFFLRNIYRRNHFLRF